MTFSRIFLPVAAAAALAACSGNLGGGQSTLPGMPNGTTNTQQYGGPTPTPTPNSASNVVSIGESTAVQALPSVMGFGGTIAFAKPVPGPSPSPNTKAPASDPAGVAGSGPVSVGITSAVVDPTDAPRLSTKGKRAGGKHADPTAVTGLLYITLLSTADVTLPEYPKIGIDVPRETAAKYRDQTYALALFDPETKQRTYRLAVAERDLSSPAPGAAPVATPTAAPAPSISGTTAMGPSAFTPPPVGTGIEAGGLPPEHVGFLATAATLTLKANRPVVFAFYAAPIPSPSPTPSGSPAGHASPPAAAVSASPAAVPAAGSSPTATLSPIPASTGSANPAPRPTGTPTGAAPSATPAR